MSVRSEISKKVNIGIYPKQVELGQKGEENLNTHSEETEEDARKGG